MAASSGATQKKLISINVSLENKVRVRKAVADNIYLNEGEIKAIAEIKNLPTKLHGTVRDLFVIGCNLSSHKLSHNIFY